MFNAGIGSSAVLAPTVLSSPPNVSDNLGGSAPTYAGYTGLSRNSAKSGLIATFSGLTLGTIPCEKLGNFYIRY